MSEIIKLEADKKLINKLFGVEPLDWSRRPDGNLVYLNQAGQKFVIPPEELDRLTDIYLDKEKILKKAGLNPAKQIHTELE